MPAVAGHASSSSSSSSSPTTPPSLLDPEDVLLGPPHFRLLKWIYQYIAAFPALTRTREDLATLLEGQVEEGLPGATAASLRLCLEETEHRATLRQCVDCLHRSEELFNTVDPGLELLKKVAKAAGMAFTVGSSLFDLAQLVLLHAGMQVAHSTVQQERDAVSQGDDDALDAAASRADDLLADLFLDRAASLGLTAAERKEQQRLFSRLHLFCSAYRDLVRHSHRDREAKKQLADVRRLFPHSALDDALSAVMVEVARTLQLPFPMLNIIEHEFITRKLKLNPPPQQPPSTASVVHMPALPIIFVPQQVPLRPVEKGAGRVGGGGVKKRGRGGGVVGKTRAAESPVREGGGGVVGGQLKAARRQLNQRGVDPLHASIDEATTLQEEEQDEEEEVAEKPQPKRKGGRPRKAAVQVEEEEDEAEVERGEEEEDEEEVRGLSQPRSQRGGKAAVKRGRKAVTRPAPAVDEDEEVVEEGGPQRPRRSATVRNYSETTDDEEEEIKEMDDDADQEPALDGAADEDDDEKATPAKRPVGRPRSDGKPAGSVKRKAAPARRGRKKARVSSPSPPGERADRRRGHRSRAYTAAEERWLKKGMIRFANHAHRWKMILNTYGQHFQEGRSAVDLKDKWRNITIKSGGGKKKVFAAKMAEQEADDGETDDEEEESVEDAEAEEEEEVKEEDYREEKAAEEQEEVEEKKEDEEEEVDPADDIEDVAEAEPSHDAAEDAQ